MFEANFVYFYGVLTALIAAIGIMIGRRCMTKPQPGAKSMGIGCFFTSGVAVTYYLSIITTNYLFTSITSSLYFICIDFMLTYFMVYTFHFTRIRRQHITQVINVVFNIWVLADIMILAINPFKEIAIHYVYRETKLAHFAYERYFLYNCHLTLSYLIVAIIAICLIYKSVTVPLEYRRQYRLVIVDILLIVALNALFLYMPGNHVWSHLDWSILGYSVVTFLLYWVGFKYSTHGMLNQFKSVIFENIGQGLVLFDYTEQLILANQKAGQLIPSVDFSSYLSMKDFASQLNIPLEEEQQEGTKSYQCEVEGAFLRCDTSVMRNHLDQIIGHLFVFTNLNQETDLLTGFQNIENFRSFAAENNDHFPAPTSVAVFDINNLGVINARSGRAEGDRRIRALADELRNLYPRTSYFVRGNDAQLFAVVHEDENGAASYIHDLPNDVDYAIAATSDTDPSMNRALDESLVTLRNKKMLNAGSSHSELIASLVQALEQTDEDTQRHVMRTRVLGTALGERIGLTDLEQSQLSLLCLLHDIGKIGIPLEILNKPGKLNPEEWKIMQSHVQKGYEIAKSSNELSGIADMILYHHERWDGAGYPAGLNKETIPMLSRIIAVVDAYDAMVNDRVYRAAMGREEAIAELKRCAGSQFDPSLVAEFIQVIEKEQQTQGTQQNQMEVAASGPKLPQMEEIDPNAFGIHEAYYTQIYLDEHLKILSADGFFEKITGYQQEDLTELPELLAPEDRPAFLMHLHQQLAAQQVISLEHEIRKKDGTAAYVFTTGHRYFSSAEKQNRLELVLVNVEQSYGRQLMQRTEHDKAMVRLRRWEDKYRTDSLTGLLSHDAFVNDVEEELLRGTHKVLMLMIDMDHFKQFNDTRGHHMGDVFLSTAAQALKNAIRTTDHAGRMGGDEFAAALLFENNVPDEKIMKAAKKVFDRITDEVRAFDLQSSVSMGAAISNAETHKFTDLYEQADRMLYQSKNAGRGQLTLGDDRDA